MKKNLVLILFCLNLGVASCGPGEISNSRSFNPNPQSDPNNSSFISAESTYGLDTVVGPCKLIGNIRSFEIECDRIIQNFTIGFFTVGKRLRNSGTINSVQYDTDIINTGRSLVGSEGLADSLEITVNFADGTTAAVSLHFIPPTQHVRFNSLDEVVWTV